MRFFGSLSSSERNNSFHGWSHEQTGFRLQTSNKHSREERERGEYFLFWLSPFFLMARCIYGDLFGKQSLTKPQPLERERAAKKKKKVPLYIRAKLGKSNLQKTRFTRQHTHTSVSQLTQSRKAWSAMKPNANGTSR